MQQSEARKVLLVDDDAELRDLVAWILESLPGITVITAENGVAALRVVQELCPSLVITDVWMPAMDGVELIQRLRDGRWAKVPILVFTVSEAQGQAAMQASAEGWLDTPFDVDDLVAKVDWQLKTAQLAPQRKESTAE